MRQPTAYQRAKKCARCLVRCAKGIHPDAATRHQIAGRLALKASRDHRLTTSQTTRLLMALRIR